MEDRAPVWYVYSRRLKGGHVYVGATNNLLRRESDALPLWVQRHGPEDGDQLLPLAYTHRHTALGLEDLWTARLMCTHCHTRWNHVYFSIAVHPLGRAPLPFRRGAP